MFTPLNQYKDKHNGEDIYILLSGNSMSYMPRSFFDGKITIGLNLMYRYFRCSYLFAKDIRDKRTFLKYYNAATDGGSEFITSVEHEGFSHLFDTWREYIVAPLGDWNGFVDPSLIGTDTIVNSHLTITSAMHIAFYMGAKNIILCGADCGLLDGKNNVIDYHIDFKNIDINHTLRTMSHPYNELNIKIMRKHLARRGCNVVSINPFVNIGLEGHVYSRVEIPNSELWAGSPDKIKL